MKYFSTTFTRVASLKKDFPDRTEGSRCLIKEDTMVPAMKMSETSIEEYTEKMRGRYPSSEPGPSGGSEHRTFNIEH